MAQQEDDDDGRSSSRSNAAEDRELMDVVLMAHVTQLRLLYTAWISHFRSGGHYIKESTMEKLDRGVCKTIFDLTVRDMKVRDAIGRCPMVWEDLVYLFQQACPSLESRSYSPADPESPSYEGGPNSNTIVQHSVSLLKDLQRLDNMLSIARNILTAGEKVQNLAAQYGFDREVCSIINLCIKITARGYDGDGTPAEEDKWQGVINGFKKLLITALQFLSNLVTLNERLKLMLWVELFDSNISNPYAPLPDPDPAASANVELTPSGLTETPDADSEALKIALQFFSTPAKAPQTKRPWEAYFTYAGYHEQSVRDELTEDDGQQPSKDDVFALISERWDALPEDEAMKWLDRYNELLPQWRKAVKDWNEGKRKTFPLSIFEAGPEYGETGRTDFVRSRDRADAAQLHNRPLEHALSTRSGPLGASQRGLFRPRPGEKIGVNASPDAGVETPYKDLFKPPPITDSDFRMSDTAEDGARKLWVGKVQLLERLERPPASRDPQNQVVSPSSPVESPRSPLPDDPEEEDLGMEDEEEDDDEDGDEDDEDDEEDDEDGEGDDLDEDSADDSSDEDYAIPGEDGRGLLTDVPLILGPNEIEVLPMIIMSGIVTPEGNLVPGKQVSEKERSTLLSMYTIRCHLLLAQENGRNLLRELLIFVAAWDLREEELYFKFMVKIMDAILMNGLMPFAYNAFKETKDIISPAQAVIMKLLTKIFSTRPGFLPNVNGQTPNPRAAELVRYDVQIVHHLFTEFRTIIVPQICALIFLQGQIRLGNANLEDFPLNLWDMERMYEGVYQYLEYFAILTDHEAWKQHMADWEVSSELITLLRELEASIPKSRVMHNPAPTDGPNVVSQSTTRLVSPPPPDIGDAPLALPESPELLPQEEPPQGPVPVSVERPFDLNSSPTQTNSQLGNAKLPPPPPAPAMLPDPSAPLSTSPSGTPYPPAPIHDEPADFEWRNLKKLCVLVLSSLVWKNSRLQDQVRYFGGVAAVLSCCQRDDEHNPYIREHAIMCLRFLVEGNDSNTAMVRALAAGKTVDAVEREFCPDVKDWRPLLPHERGGPLDTPDRRRGALGDPATGTLAVPPEVLDTHGYETYMDAKGQVGLRRRATPTTDRSAASSASTDPALAAAAAAAAAAPILALGPGALNAMRATLEASLRDASRGPPSSATFESWMSPLIASAGFDPLKSLGAVTPEMVGELMSGSVAETFERIAREAKAAAQGVALNAKEPGAGALAAAQSLEETLAKGMPEWMQAIIKDANALGRSGQGAR